MASSDKKKMLQCLTFHREEIDNWVIHTGCLERSRKSPSSAVHFTKKCKFPPNTKSSLGNLNVPVEILHEVLSYLTILEISNFRSVNPLAEAVVNSITKYHEIITYAPNTVEALIITGAANYFTVDNLSNALRSKICGTCGKYGMFLFILTCTRCCDTCLRGAGGLSPLKASEAKACFGLTQKQLKASVPVITTLPGIYCLGAYDFRQRTYKGTFKLVDRLLAREAGIAVHGGEEDMRQYIRKSTQKKIEAYTKRLIIWESLGSITRRKPRQPAFTDLPYYKCDGIQRFMAATPIPYYNITTGKAQSGICCIGCENARESPKFVGWSSMKNPYINYLEEEWLVHFLDCSDSQELWELSEHGNMKVGAHIWRQKDD